MKKLLLLSITILLLQSNMLAQAPDTLWTKTFGGIYDGAVRQTCDGGYIIAGFKEFISPDVYLVKTDSSGDTLWTKTYGGIGIEVGNSVQQTSDGGYIVAGTAGDSNLGQVENVYLIKTDSSGGTLWTKTFGGTGNEEGKSIQQTSDGGYIVAGFTSSFGAGGDDVYLIKTDSSGDTLWTKTYGGIGSDDGKSVQQTSDGGYIVAGSTSSFGAGGDDVYLIKTDSSGDKLWTKTYGGIDWDIGNSVQQTSDGGYIVAGSTSSFGAGGGDVYLIKTDSSGNTLWTKTLGGTGSDEGKSVQQTSDGGYIVAGTALIKTNSSGDMRWTKTFWGTSVQQTSDGGYIVIGNTFLGIRLIKLAPNSLYPYDITSDKTYYSIGQDTIHLSTIIENPNSHQLTARGYIYNLNDDLIDSTDLTKQAITTDGEKWTGEANAPQMEDYFKISVNVFDQSTIKNIIAAGSTRFTTTGPLKVDSIEYGALSNFRYSIKPTIKNESNSLLISNIKTKLYCNDPWVTLIYPSFRICPDIPPGSIQSVNQAFAVTYDSATFPGYFNLEFKMLSDDWPYWTDSPILTVVTGIEEELSVPSEFNLEQNYPNPFNPTTTIKYSIPKLSFVTIKIYDVLGSEVATLANEEKPVGSYELNWNAVNLPSGVYFYRLQAGSFIQTRKMVLLK